MDPANAPALTPPPGITPDFAHPESRALYTIIISAISLTLMGMFAAVRVYSRIYITRAWTKDDTACMFAVIASIVHSAASFSLLSHIFGRHQWDIPIQKFDRSVLERFFLVNTVFAPAIFLTKLSLFLLYLRIFSPSRTMKYFIYFGISFDLVADTVGMLAQAILCSFPLHGPWTLLAVAERCNRTQPWSIFQGVINVISNFYLIILPIPVILGLQLPLRKRIGICAIFMTGLLACLSSCFTLYYRIRLNQSPDITWNATPLLFVGVVEVNVGIICGCMPFLAPFFQHKHIPDWLRLPSFKAKSKFVFASATRSYNIRRGSARELSAFGRIDSKPSDIAIDRIKVTDDIRIELEPAGMNDYSLPEQYPHWMNRGPTNRN